MTSAELKIKKWRQNPVAFVRDVFHVEPDAWQAEVLKAFPNERRLALLACKGPGKTCVLAWLAWNFLLTRPNPKVVATSISKDNLKDGLWTEMAKWQARSELLKELFIWNKERIQSKEHYKTWWMSARTWTKGADTDQQANTLAGIHEDYMLFILDEVGGIPDAVMAAADAGLATGIETKILMAGNPTHLEGPLYRAATRERDMWFLVSITADPDDPNRTPRVSKEWANEQIKKYGRDNPWVLVNVFGKFPPSSLNSLLGPDDVAGAMGKHLTEDQYSFAQKRLGIDVARFGDDRTIIFPRQGLASFMPAEMRGARTNEIAARVAAAKAKWGSELEFVDGTGGWGAGVIDFLYQAKLTPQEINFAGRAYDDRYENKRAEMWFEMANWIKRGGALPNLPELQKELTAPTYTFTKRGKFLLESKEQIKDRLGFSPDLADALCLTFAFPEQPASLNGDNSGNSKYIYDYDPFDDSRS